MLLCSCRRHSWRSGCTSTVHTPATPSTGGTTTGGTTTVEEAEVGDTAVTGTTSPASAPHGTVAVSQPATSVPHLGLYCVLPTLPGAGIASCMTTGSIPTCSSPVIVGTGPCWIDGAATGTTPAANTTVAQNLP